MRACPTDFALTGGDFDFGLLSICDHLAKRAPLAAGIWYRDRDDVRDTGPPGSPKRNYAELPLIDPDLTRWELYGQHLFYKRCTSTMVGRDCWRPRCTFCSWTTLWPRFGTRPAESLLDEIGAILARYRIKEIFDDTGTFPVGAFLRKFCRGMIDRGYHRR